MKPRPRTPAEILAAIGNHRAYLLDSLRAQIGPDITVNRGYLVKVTRTLGHLLALAEQKPPQIK